MATAEAPSRPHDRHGRRHPFANWMKRLANLKSSSSSGLHSNSSNHKHQSSTTTAKGKKSARNNPYPLSGNVYSPGVERTNGHLSFSEPANSLHRSDFSHSDSNIGENEQISPMTGRKSAAPTLSTNGDTILSDAAYSKAGTSATAGGGRSCRGGGEGSTFSSPAPSVRSLTTTLTTVQSGAPNHYITGGVHSTTQGGSQQTVQFSHQFPTTPVSAIPPHITQQPTTYVTATANNLLTDNASVLTLASSSKRRRRNSLDTNASIRALAPSSIFSGSRESLPLSVLSGNMGSVNTAAGGAEFPNTASSTLTRGGLVGGERASVYSASGAGVADRGSIRSGLQSHHVRNDSATGSIGGITANSYLPNAQGRVSRRGSGWGEIPDSEPNEVDEDSTTTGNGEMVDSKGQEKSNN
ncbi:predicted protein [Uncinocarpus reesii 1704]|uniref:Ca2+-modulated nonselective cation channel polycystin n=1 Tax=Uncinocarpus reesii (strain UAMH 1704) TaxID=336963 RepID=C4JW57_UNCRE|nr:uncharacterized protein UREG_06799 [Uncinocarpus reesii 1704]EEP81934.1 predicted protein [Uncinocarpus reesii 1704]